MEAPYLPELSTDERHALVALVRNLVVADGHVSDSEMYDLVELGVSLGQEEFGEAMRATRDIHRDRLATLELARRVTREGVRRVILSIVEQVAEGDGVHFAEVELIHQLRAIWGR
ncbi:MAG: hypothetical protein R3F61_29825 [Myxococcota bacterium]